MLRSLLFLSLLFSLPYAANAIKGEHHDTYDQNIQSYSNNDRIVLRKDTGTTFAGQVTQANTVYEIRDVFDLNNKTVVIPENCTLVFSGGSIKNGTIVGNNTYLFGTADAILNNSLHFRDVDKFQITGIAFPKGKDISASAQKMLDVFNILELENGTYYLSSTLIVKNHYAKIKGAGKGTILTTNKNLDYAIRTVFDSEAKSTGTYYNASFIEISDLKIDGTNSKYFKNGLFLDGPSCTVENCFVTQIKSVGIKLSEWCNNLFNCIITHCDIGALITLRANGVNLCYNRIESNNVNVVVQGYRGVNISNNTLEGGALFNIVVGSGQGCKIRDNYFEGCAGSITNKVSTTESRSLAFNGKKELKGLIWIGTILLSEKEHVAKIEYKIGSPNAPSSVLVDGNYIDIHREDKGSSPAPEVHFALIGSCSDYCIVKNNSFSHPQNAVCGFFDTDNAILGNAEVVDNYVIGKAQKVKSLELITDNYSKTGWRAKNHFKGKLTLDEKIE